MAAIIAGMRMAWLMWRPGVHPIVASVCAACVAAWLLAVASVQRTLSAEHDRLMRAIETTGPEQEILYADLHTWADLPWWADEHCMGVLTHRMHLGKIVSHSDRALLVLPERFRGTPVDSLPLIKGTAGLRGVYPLFLVPDSLSATAVDDRLTLKVRLSREADGHLAESPLERAEQLLADPDRKMSIPLIAISPASAGHPAVYYMVGPARRANHPIESIDL